MTSMPEQAKETVSKPIRRHGVPAWRTGKPDAVLADAVEVARQEILSIAKAEHLGAHLAVRSEGERVATHLFECSKPGYQGWQWFAVLARAPRAKVVTVSEVGLLPTDESVLAPEWLPWSERVRPEDAEDLGAEEAAKAEDLTEPAVAASEPGESGAESAGITAGEAASVSLETAPTDQLEAAADVVGESGSAGLEAETASIAVEASDVDPELATEPATEPVKAPRRRRAVRAKAPTKKNQESSEPGSAES